MRDRKLVGLIDAVLVDHRNFALTLEGVLKTRLRRPNFDECRMIEARVRIDLGAR